ncbi:MAG TPA: hypothetical protein VF590_14870, partial [Isosphaeraceae bacterium]
MRISLGRQAGGSMRAGGRRVFLVALALGLAVRPSAGRAEGLDRELLRQVPAVLRYLKAHGYRNVGVLKFRVKTGDEPVRDNVGPLNLNLAGRLQIALVLANDLDDPLGIIRDADTVAATLPGANHLTQTGRQALFRGRYLLAWGDQVVEPDAFLTGVAVLSPDLTQMTVALLAFGRDGTALEKVAQFTAATDPPTLVEAGASFLLRGAFDNGRPAVVRDQVIATAARVQAAPETNPVCNNSGPVALEIRYDGRPIPLEIRAGRAAVREPVEGQAVSFVLRKVDATPERYGVVLLVNGENTLFKERTAPLHAGKWILGPEHREATIHGYQIGAKTAESFHVQSPEESWANVMRYGPAAGTITLVVFRAQRARDEPPPLDDEAEDLIALSRGVLPPDRPRTLEALKFLVRET